MRLATLADKATTGYIYLAQNFGTGGGAEDITNTIDNVSYDVTNIIHTVAALAFILALGFGVWAAIKGQGIASVFGPIGVLLVVSLALGLGPSVMDWFFGIGESAAGA